MASSSPARISCSNAKCRNVMDVSKPGWKGDKCKVKLCYQCFIAFSTKQFCNIYHEHLGVWIMCRSCNKKVHLECEVSRDSYTKLQGGEVICNGCVTPDVILISDSEETIVNSTSSPSPIAIVPTTLFVNDQLTDKENVLDTHNEELTPKPLSIEYNGNNAYTETQPQVEALNRKRHSRSGRKNKQYRPRMTEQEVKEISNRFGVKVKPLFEKRLTASDVARTGRLVIPKQCAEDYFPWINNSKGKCLVILDADRTEWKFDFKFWPNSKTRIYFLEGFHEFVKSVKLRQGDKVTFSRLGCERKLVIGYRKVPSTSSSSLVDRFHKTTTASTSTKRAKKGVVTSAKKNENSRDNGTSANRKPNAPVNAKSDVGGAKVHICSIRRKRDIGSTSKSNKNLINLSEVIEEVRETIQSPHGSNIPSFVVTKDFQTKSNKKRAPKRKSTCDALPIFIQENPNELERLRLNTLKPNVPIHSKRKSSYKIGSSSESTKKVNQRPKVKDARAPEVEETQGTLIENVVALSIHPKRKSTYEIGSSSKSTKKVNKRSKVKDAGELVALPEAVETQVTAIENVVTLPSQPNANKKHPRHRLDCLCIVCIQPASGSKHHVSCECRACVTIRSRGKKYSLKPRERVASRQRKGLPKPTLQTESSNACPPNPAEPGSPNHTHQTTVINRVSEDNGNTNLSSMHSKILPFDLNFPPEFNEDF